MIYLAHPIDVAEEKHNPFRLIEVLKKAGTGFVYTPSKAFDITDTHGTNSSCSFYEDSRRLCSINEAAINNSNAAIVIYSTKSSVGIPSELNYMIRSVNKNENKISIILVCPWVKNSVVLSAMIFGKNITVFETEDELIDAIENNDHSISCLFETRSDEQILSDNIKQSFDFIANLLIGEKNENKEKNQCEENGCKKTSKCSNEKCNEDCTGDK